MTEEKCMYNVQCSCCHTYSACGKEPNYVGTDIGRYTRPNAFRCEQHYQIDSRDNDYNQFKWWRLIKNV